MEIQQTTQNDVTVLGLTGRLDGLSSPLLEKRVTELLAGGVRKLVLDCGALLYVSSAGLRTFLTAAKKFQVAGGRVAFANLSPAVAEVFELSGFIGILEVQPTAGEAVTSLS